MNSKEALERLGAEKLARGQLIRNDDKVEIYINCIKQDLERLEKVEKENQKLKEELNRVKLALKNTINGVPFTIEVKEMVNSKEWLNDE